MSNENEFVESLNRLETLMDSNQQDLKRDVASLIDLRFSSLKEEVNKLKSQFINVLDMLVEHDKENRRDLCELSNRIRALEISREHSNDHKSTSTHDLDSSEVSVNVEPIGFQNLCVSFLHFAQTQKPKTVPTNNLDGNELRSEELVNSRDKTVLSTANDANLNKSTSANEQINVDTANQSSISITIDTEHDQSKNETSMQMSNETTSNANKIDIPEVGQKEEDNNNNNGSVNKSNGTSQGYENDQSIVQQVDQDYHEPSEANVKIDVPEMDANPNQDCDTDLSHLLMFPTRTSDISMPLQRMRPIKQKTEINKREIDNLPNQCLKTILSKLTWSQLIHLRVVCKRWRAVVHSMGEEKKLLIVNYLGEQTKLKGSFFGALDLHNSARVYLKWPNVSTSELRPIPLVVGLFPSVDQFVLNFEDKYPIDIFLESNLYLLPSKITSLLLSLNDSYEIPTESHHRLAIHINQLTSLKQLELCGEFATLLPLIGPTLHRVEHFSYSTSYVEAIELSEIVRNVGQNCTRFALNAKALPYSNILSTMNRNWLNQLTHLQLRSNIVTFDQLAQFLSENVTSLQVFRFEAISSTNTVDKVRINLPTITSQAMNDLSRLVHLVELELKCVFLDYIHINVGPLVNILTCSLCLDLHYLTSDRFTRILSTIFPNVQHLDITLMRRCGLDWYPGFTDFGQYLDRFTALRTHKFVLEEHFYN